jgi:hypothetical protein
VSLLRAGIMYVSVLVTDVILAAIVLFMVIGVF